MKDLASILKSFAVNNRCINILSQESLEAGAKDIEVYRGLRNAINGLHESNRELFNVLDNALSEAFTDQIPVKFPVSGGKIVTGRIGSFKSGDRMIHVIDSNGNHHNVLFIDLILE